MFSHLQNSFHQVEGLSVEWIHIIKNVPKIAQKFKNSLEHTASRIRKKELKKLTKKHKGIIFLGHTLSDWYETILMRMNRGTSLKKLIPFDFYEESISQVYCRPLYLCFRDEVRITLKKFNIPFWDDPMNQNESILRNHVRKNFNILNEEGLRKSAIRFLEEKEPKNFPFEVLSTNVELRVPLHKAIDLKPNLSLIMDRMALDHLGLGAFSRRFYQKLKQNRLSLPPYFLELENWNGICYKTYRRGRTNLWDLKREGRKVIDQFFSEKGIPYKLIRADRLTKSYKIRFSYGRKNVKAFLQEKNISERQRKNLFLGADFNDPKSILIIPLSIFGLRSVYSEQLF